MRYLIVHTPPQRHIEKYKSSISGGLFSYNLKASGIFDTTYSILPSNIYNYKENFDEDDIHVIYSKLRSKFKPIQLFACLSEQIKMFRIINRDSQVWLYNLCILNFLLFVLLKLLKRSVGVNIIVADFSPGEGLNSFYLWLTNKADGLITLSNSSLFKVKNLKILPGIVPESEKYPTIQTPVRRNFLLSGALNERIASTSVVIETFGSLDKLELNISGRYARLEQMNGYTSKYANVRYHGVLSYEGFKSMLDNNSFVLSTRDPSYPENQCNFPSKVLEALLHNRIIISTIHYPQLDGIKYFEVPCDIDGMKNSLSKIAAMSDDELLTYANQGEKVMKMFSPLVWRQVIENLESRDER